MSCLILRNFLYVTIFAFSCAAYAKDDVKESIPDEKELSYIEKNTKIMDSEERINTDVQKKNSNNTNELKGPLDRTEKPIELKEEQLKIHRQSVIRLMNQLNH